MSQNFVFTSSGAVRKVKSINNQTVRLQRILKKQASRYALFSFFFCDQNHINQTSSNLLFQCKKQSNSNGNLLQSMSAALTNTSIAASDLCSSSQTNANLSSPPTVSSHIKTISDYWDDILRICEDAEQFMDRKHSGSVCDLYANRPLTSSDALLKTKSEPDILLKVNKEDELLHLRNTVIELRKLCGVIIGQLQHSHESVAELRNNLTQKELLSVSLSKQLLELKANYCLQRLQSLQQNHQMEKDELIESTLASKGTCTCDSNSCLVQKMFAENERIQKRLYCVLRSLQQLSAELRESHANYDHLEMAFNWMRNEMKSLLKMRNDECELMRERVNYLTSKLLTVDRAYRTAITKLAKFEKQDKLDKRKAVKQQQPQKSSTSIDNQTTV